MPLFRKYKFQIYRDLPGEWRFRLLAPNGKIIADSGESYTTKRACVRNIRKIQKKAGEALIVEKTD